MMDFSKPNHDRNHFRSYFKIGLLFISLSLFFVNPSLGKSSDDSVSYFTTPAAYEPEGGYYWEPFLASSPSGDLFLWATTKYHDDDDPRDCKKPPCPDPSIVYKTNFQNESDAGIVLCGGRKSPCKDTGEQNDPVAAINEDGEIFFTWMNDWNISIYRADSQSDVQRGIWDDSTFVLSLQDPPEMEADKPWIAAKGDNVWVAYSASNEGHLFVRTSTDRGNTWQPQVQLTSLSNEYHFPSGMIAGPNDTVCLSTNKMPNNYTDTPFESVMYVFCSTYPYTKWIASQVDVSKEGPACPPSAGCGFEREFLLPSIAMSGDEKGILYVLYAKSLIAQEPSRICFSKTKSPVSVSSGSVTPLEWTDCELASLDESTSVHHSFPMIAARGEGDVRIAWMDNRTGDWNLFYRESSDGGKTWSIETIVSRQGNFNYSWDTDKGFLFPYGDYGYLVIDSEGNSWLTWGEGESHDGAGNSFISKQTSRLPLYSAPSHLAYIVIPIIFLLLAGAGIAYFFYRRSEARYRAVSQDVEIELETDIRAL